MLQCEYVEISGIQCPQNKVGKGVPQGSRTCPLLFILNVIDTTKYSKLQLVLDDNECIAFDVGTNLETLTS